MLEFNQIIFTQKNSSANYGDKSLLLLAPKMWNKI